jgi:hypothetical protein
MIFRIVRQDGFYTESHAKEEVFGSGDDRGAEAKGGGSRCSLKSYQVGFHDLGEI